MSGSPWLGKLAAAVGLRRGSDDGRQAATRERTARHRPPWAARAVTEYLAGQSASVLAKQLSGECGERISPEAIRRELRAAGVMRTVQQAARINPHAGRHLVGSGKPAGEMTARTARTYRSRWRQYLRWCNARGIEPYGIDTATLERFALDLIEEGRPVGAVTGILVAVRHMHVQAGLDAPGAVPRLRERAVRLAGRPELGDVA